MERFLRQQHITNKNRARLGMLTKSGNQRTREIAAFITRIAAIAPRKRKRFEHLSTNDPDVLWEWKRLELPIPIEYLIELDAHLSMEDECSLDADAIYEWESKDADGNYDDNNIIVKRGVAPPDYEGPCYTTDDGRELPF